MTTSFPLSPQFGQEHETGHRSHKPATDRETDVVEQYVRPHNNCYWVIPGRFLAGEYPGAYRATAAFLRIQSYVYAGVTHFLDLTHPDDGLSPYEPVLRDVAKITGIDLSYQRAPIYDMSIPSLEEMGTILDAIDDALANNANIYVHCWGGIGRTGTVIGCYLVRHGLDGETAIAQLAEWWQHVEKSVRNPRSPETDEQMAMIRTWVVGR